MQLLKHINSFMGGMNKDLSTSSFKEDTYFDAQNIRVVSGDDTFQTETTTPPTIDTGCVSNIRGTTECFEVPNNGRIVGSTTLGDNLILLASWKGMVTEVAKITPGVGLITYTATAPDHGLAVGDVACLVGTQNFNNRIFIITAVTADTFSTQYAVPISGYETESNLTGAYWYIPKFYRITDIIGTGGAFDYQFTAPHHGLTNGDYIFIYGTGDTNFDNSATDMLWKQITVNDADHFTVTIVNNPADLVGLTNAYAYTLDCSLDKVYRIPFEVLDDDFGEVFELQDNYYFLSTETSVYGTAPSKYDALVYQQDLGLNPCYNVDVIANYETEDIQKIYWCDGFNQLRHLNIVYNYANNNLINLDPDLTNMVPSSNHESITVTLQNGGTLKTGKIQYAYQLYVKHGAETSYSPASKLINLTPNSDNPPNSDDFKGGDLSDVVSKSCVVTVDVGTLYLKFNRIRLVALEYEAYATNPTVRVVIESDLTAQTITLYDYGYSIGTLTLDSFRLIQNEISPTTLVTKNNYLIAGNIRQKYFDAVSTYEDAVLADTSGATFFPRLDTRAYRWRVLNPADTAAGKSNTNDVNMVLIPEYSYIHVDAYGEWRWQVTFALSAETDAAALGYTFTSINLDTIYQNHSDVQVTIDGDMFLLLLKDYNTHEICSEITYEEFGGASDYLTIKGNRYGRDSEQRPPSQDYNRFDIDAAVSKLISKQINYSYNYTYVVPGGLPITDCVLGFGLASHTVVDSTKFEDIPLDHDAINTYNDNTNDFTAVNEFKWQEDGLTIGGEGPLISYTFAHDRDIYLGTEITKSPGSYAVLVNTAPYSNYLNYLTCRDYVGYMRDEVYRFGIIFYDLQLRPSFVNWIGDIRFPNYYDMPPFDTEGYGHVLYINFTVAWGSFPEGFKDKVSGFRIVRAIRRSADKTIKCQGVIGMTLLDTNTAPDQNWSSYYLTTGSVYDQAVLGAPAPANTADCGGAGHVIDAGWTFNEHLLEMLSPEISFNKEYSYAPTDYLEVVGTSNGATFDASYNETLDPHYRDVTQTFDCVDEVAALGLATTRGSLGGVIDETILSLPELKDPAAHVVDVHTYYARGSSPHDVGSPEQKTLSYKGTSLVIGFSTSGITDVATLASTGIMVANIKAALGLSMYGGSTYEQRSNTIYIPAGDFCKTGAVMNVYGGDTYLCYFNCLKLFADEDEVDGEGTWQTYVTFPVETAINIDWRNDQLQKNITFDSTAADERATYHLNEYETWGIEDYAATYPDDVGNLYVYNSAYSCWDDSKEFLPEPFDFSSADYYGNRVTSSDHKIANEYTDSWLKFKYVNYLDTESRYGNITKLVKINNNVIFFQPKAVGSLSVEERELIQSQNVGALSLGTGGVLSRYDYLTTTSGCSWPRAIVTSEGNVYYFDYYNKNLRRLVQEGAEPISELKGLKTYFNNKLTTGTNVVLGYDRENREVLCGLSDALWGDNTVVYSLFTDSFLGLQTFSPLHFIEVGNTVFSSPDNNTFWKHNLGERGKFYGTYGDSYITVCVNPLKINTATYHIIEWLTDKYSDSPVALIPDETLTYIDLWNSYQDGKRLSKYANHNILAYVDYSFTIPGTVAIAVVPGHDLVTGSYVTITGSINYNGDYKVTVIDATTFYITHTWLGDDTVGLMTHDGYTQRFRKWRANLLREDSDDSRLRDNHLFVKLVYENDSDDNKIVLHPLTTGYIPTKI